MKEEGYVSLHQFLCAGVPFRDTQPYSFHQLLGYRKCKAVLIFDSYHVSNSRGLMQHLCTTFPSRKKPNACMIKTKVSPSPIRTSTDTIINKTQLRGIGRN